MLVLCLNLGRTYTFDCRRKSKRASKWLGFFVDVLLWSAPALTLNQRVRISSLRRRTKVSLDKELWLFEAAREKLITQKKPVTFSGQNVGISSRNRKPNLLTADKVFVSPSRRRISRRRGEWGHLIFNQQDISDSISVVYRRIGVGVCFLAHPPEQRIGSPLLLSFDCGAARPHSVVNGRTRP